MNELIGHYCTKCEYVLPENFKAGQRCPNCKVKIAFMENADGSFTNQSGKRVSNVPGPYTTGLSIIIAAVVLIGLFLRLLGGR